MMANRTEERTNVWTWRPIVSMPNWRWKWINNWLHFPRRMRRYSTIWPSTSHALGIRKIERTRNRPRQSSWRNDWQRFANNNDPPLKWSTALSSGRKSNVSSGWSVVTCAIGCRRCPVRCRCWPHCCTRTFESWCVDGESCQPPAKVRSPWFEAGYCCSTSTWIWCWTEHESTCRLGRPIGRPVENACWAMCFCEAIRSCTFRAATQSVRPKQAQHLFKSTTRGRQQVHLAHSHRERCRKHAIASVKSSFLFWTHKVSVYVARSAWSSSSNHFSLSSNHDRTRNARWLAGMRKQKPESRIVAPRPKRARRRRRRCEGQLMVQRSATQTVRWRLCLIKRFNSNSWPIKFWSDAAKTRTSWIRQMKWM